MEPGKVAQIFKNGLVLQNPTLVLLLGMCSTLAVTTSLKNAVCMGLSTTAVLLCSNLVISLLRHWIPKQIRIACYVVVVASFVTIVDLLLQAYLPALSESLGIFIPLIVVNCIILARAEAFASKHTPGYAAMDGLAMGLGFTASLSILGVVRELLGSGTLWGVSVLGEGFQPMLLVVAPCGGFIVLGCVIAVAQWARSLAERRGKT
ncbi:RnfABCDGE type electron transport complex subunit E [Pseudoflavonifractor sp. BIOML-A6]|nr:MULTISPECIES: electron transport complex subunit E [unclassified Pseudoflavonifractor]MTQ95889.1 RnfABCDGE type electron transport complex subunit E [Pseudoflavonifractor sp. BIOML-A16]MTR04641.1 RnfABCDGE type electron transport complex subunit E [Pseudoflavonifractor sp. BIOML-A15]MTR31111.1 RnfABCDGE type electron transport complex subunit E [Pseudoflavonifractor sp. BIOML-A14]MTR71676.1 RnfABCDGE type electron transport complex subunit E [Pseudoflavonifractor sp. BIOML-A18]MTS62781.1 Rn